MPPQSKAFLKQLEQELFDPETGASIGTPEEIKALFWGTWILAINAVIMIILSIVSIILAISNSWVTGESGPIWLNPLAILFYGALILALIYRPTWGRWVTFISGVLFLPLLFYGTILGVSLIFSSLQVKMIWGKHRLTHGEIQRRWTLMRASLSNGQKVKSS
jgi:hypothetical protein